MKSTTVANGGGYVCMLRRQGKAYGRGSFDFIAAYVVPEDVWYIIPATKLRGREYVNLCSNSKQAKNEEYREAWHLLRKAAELGGEAETDAVEPAAGAELPMGVLGRMEAVEDYCRRVFEGKYPRRVKE